MASRSCVSLILLLLSNAALLSSAAAVDGGKVAKQKLKASILEALTTADILEPIAARIDIPPKDHSVKAGGSAELACEAFGAPPPTIRWLKNGKKLGEGKPFEEGNIIEQISNSGLETYEQGSTKSRLKFPCLGQNDVGLYTCVAENSAKVEANATVAVLESNDVGPLCLHKKTYGVIGQPATIYMWTSYRIERQGANVQLYCRARGNPTPKIAWFIAGEKEEELLPVTNGDVFQVLKNGDLMVKGLHVQDACTAPGCEFVCVATNPFGRDKAETYLYATELDENEIPKASDPSLDETIMTKESNEEKNDI